MTSTRQVDTVQVSSMEAAVGLISSSTGRIASGEQRQYRGSSSGQDDQQYQAAVEWTAAVKGKEAESSSTVGRSSSVGSSSLIGSSSTVGSSSTGGTVQ